MLHHQVFTICHICSWTLLIQWEQAFTQSMQKHCIWCFGFRTLSCDGRVLNRWLGRGISLSCWAGTKLGLRQEEIEIGRNGQQTAVLSYAAPQCQAADCHQHWGVSAAFVWQERDRTKTLYCHKVATVQSWNLMLSIWCQDFQIIFSRCKINVKCQANNSLPFQCCCLFVKKWRSFLFYAFLSNLQTYKCCPQCN